MLLLLHYSSGWLKHLKSEIMSLTRMNTLHYIWPFDQFKRYGTLVNKRSIENLRQWLLCLQWNVFGRITIQAKTKNRFVFVAFIANKSVSLVCSKLTYWSFGQSRQEHKRQRRGYNTLKWNITINSAQLALDSRNWKWLKLELKLRQN